LVIISAPKIPHMEEPYQSYTLKISMVGIPFFPDNVQSHIHRETYRPKKNTDNTESRKQSDPLTGEY
jgi:hypothetical protein